MNTSLKTLIRIHGDGNPGDPESHEEEPALNTQPHTPTRIHGDGNPGDPEVYQAQEDPAGAGPDEADRAVATTGLPP